MVKTNINIEESSIELKEADQSVTQPQQLELYQKWQEELFQTIFNNSPIGIYIVQDGLFCFMNPRFLELSGFNADELINTNSLLLVHPDDRDMVKQKAIQTLKGEISIEYEYRIIDKHGEIKWILEKVTSIQYQGRRATLGHFVDITARKRVEEEIRIKSSAMASATNGIAISDLEGKLIYVNNAFVRMWGYDSDNEVLGKPLTGFWESPDKVSVGMETLKEKGRWTGELVGLKMDGAHFYTELSASLIVDEDEKPTYLMASFIDSTKRKRAEEALRESEKRFRDLGELLPETIFEMDAEGDLTFANEAAYTIFGISTEQPDSGSPVLQIIVPQDRDRARDNIQKLLNGEKLGDIEYTAVRRDGSLIPVNMYANRIIRGNEAVGLRGIIIDISRHKQIQKELEDTLAKLEKSNTELEQFAYIASHDLQEPLRMIASYTQLIARRYQGQLDDDADEFISFAVDGVHRMQTLINDLLAYSRVTTGSKPFETTESETVVDQALSNLQLAIEESEATITRDPLPVVMADPSQLLRLFQNLIGNAIKFRRDAAPEIHIGARQEEGAWLFSIRDNGIGIDPEHSERIFVIFQRLHNKTEYAGTGIGLSICKKIVERHGGRIWVEPNEDNGSTFYFTIPLKGSD